MNWFATQLLDWYDNHGYSDFPWQHQTNPYRVWLSEIMLQQTQVATVIPYYERFVAQFPDLTSLAEASQDKVLAMWTGLGYYARGRNLHATAKIIIHQHNGVFPNTLSGLRALPGIGPSTAGAILASAFNKRGVILDGNVKRVLARYFLVAGYASKTNQRLWDLAEHNTPKIRNSDYNQAAMNLGATICGRKPDCNLCPLTTKCQANQNNCVDQFPQRKPKKTKPTKNVRMFVISNEQQQLYLEQQPTKGVWGGLWSPPVRATSVDTTDILQELNVQRHDLVKQATKEPFRHTFSHYHLQIEPIWITIRSPAILSEANTQPPALWLQPQQKSDLGLSAVAVKLIQQFEDAL